MMIVKLKDEIDLKIIQKSGQCFRVEEIKGGLFRFITGKNIVYIREKSKKEIEVSCDEKTWKNVWEEYFDLGTDYAKICKEERGKNSFADAAMEFGRGLRILKQDEWEMLISFIISQRKSIPAISSCIEALCDKFGEKIETEYEKVNLFPTPQSLLNASADELKACGLGYRAPYIRDAAMKVAAGELDLNAISTLSDDELFERLLEVHGVGKKVANCVLLFGYARKERVPIDVWISRVIDEEFGGENLFPIFGKNGGIMQQYIFYYEKNR